VWLSIEEHARLRRRDREMRRGQPLGLAWVRLAVRGTIAPAPADQDALTLYKLAF
jgi:hypothetical protein